jgi:hypothetical protein
MMQRESKHKTKGKGSAPNSKKNLELGKWLPGQSGNPAGKVKGTLNLKERLQTYLALDIKIKMPDGSIQDKSVLDGIVLSLLSQAQKGNIQAIREVFDRNFGKEADVLQIESHEDRLKRQIQELKA